MRVRGLKYMKTYTIEDIANVAPHAGAWIEMAFGYASDKRKFVAPHAGAWIEISEWYRLFRDTPKSHPMRVRGLKYLIREGI